MWLRQARSTPHILNDRIQAQCLMNNQLQFARHVRRPSFFPFQQETDRTREAQKLGAGPCVKKPYLKKKIDVAVRDVLARK